MNPYILTAFLACFAAPSAAQTGVPAGVPSAASAVVSTPTLTVEQAYRPANTRDPLVPATVYGDLKGSGPLAQKGAGAEAKKSTFTVYGLSLTGIMEDSRGRQALLRDASGEVYTLKAGSLTDSKKKVVPGVSGVVKGKQVTLMTEDKKVHHLSLRENE